MYPTFPYLKKIISCNRQNSWQLTKVTTRKSVLDGVKIRCSNY
uniref:Uncharacterized protein n=1 Tax=Arundo donax TaxID=35708 RepID=A0A0A9G6T6_ARUDO